MFRASPPAELPPDQPSTYQRRCAYGSKVLPVAIMRLVARHLGRRLGFWCPCPRIRLLSVVLFLLISKIMSENKEKWCYWRFLISVFLFKRKKKVFRIHQPWKILLPRKVYTAKGVLIYDLCFQNFHCEFLLLRGRLLIKAENEKKNRKTESWVKQFTSTKHKSYEGDFIKPERQIQHLCSSERQRKIFITPTAEIPQSKF